MQDLQDSRTGAVFLGRCCMMSFPSDTEVRSEKKILLYQKL